MQTKMKFVWTGIAAALLAAPCFPQTAENKPEQTKYFRLDFTVRELEGGKVVTSRSYSTTLSNEKGDNVSIRTGDKVPIITGKDQSVSYQDVGVNIDCNSLKLVDSQVALYIRAAISSVVADVQDKIPFENSGPGNPVIRNTSWGSTVLVPLKKTVTVFSSDGATTKRQTQLELTATPIP
jgi:hypothetical protein